MRSYTICMICDSFDIGGAETHVLTLANALSATGHSITLVTGGGAYTASLKKDIKVILLPIGQRGRFCGNLFRLRRLFGQERFDVLHAHTRMAALYCRVLCPARTVVSAHWVFDTSFPKKQLSFWGKETLAVSPDIKEYLRHSYSLPEEQIRVTVNGIDQSVFAPKEKRETPKISLCSRLDSDRAMAAFALLPAAARLSDTYPFALEIIGDGDCMASLQDLAAKLKEKHPRFSPSFLGGRTDVSALLADADIFVGVSRAALEALSSECAVILAGNEGYLSVFDPDFPAEAERSNFCCRGASPVTEEALYRDLARLLALPQKERSLLGKKGRAYVGQQYSVARMREDAEGVYDKCAKDKAVLCGYYGAGNVGDELLLLALKRRLKTEGYGRVLPLSRRHPSLLAVYAICHRYDFFLGGGNLLQDATSRRSLTLYLSLLSFAQRQGCRASLISAGIGPLSEKGKRRVRTPLSRAHLVECRTTKDAEEAIRLGARRVRLRADAVLSLPFPPKEKSGQAILLAFRTPKKENEAFVRRIVYRLISLFPERCLFFAMHPSDLSFGKRLAREFSIPCLSGDASLFLEAMRRSVLVVGDRLHAAVCALGMGIPFFVDGENKKCAHFLADVKKAAKDGGFCGDLREEFPKKLPSDAGIKEAKDRVLRR